MTVCHLLRHIRPKAETDSVSRVQTQLTVWQRTHAFLSYQFLKVFTLYTCIEYASSLEVVLVPPY